jgi:hypothetical protein
LIQLSIKIEKQILFKFYTLMTGEGEGAKQGSPNILAGIVILG